MHSVLVIDDDESLRTVLARWVDMSGYRAREADSAEEALYAMEREVASEGESIGGQLEEFRLKSLLSGPDDFRDAQVDVGRFWSDGAEGPPVSIGVGDDDAGGFGGGCRCY